MDFHLLVLIIDPFPAAVIGFSLNVGAYASEVIRAAIFPFRKVSGKQHI